MSYHFSGSEAERALACPSSTVLPSVGQVVGRPAHEGIAIHAFLEMCSEFKDTDKALKLIETTERWAPFLEVCEAIDVATLPTELAHEVAFAFDCETGEARELGRGINRNYTAHNLKRYEIPLTLDAIGVSADAVFVGDYKTGRVAVTRARRNVQVGLGAVCAAQVYGRENAVVEIIKPGKDGGKPYRDRAELDMFDLDELAAQFCAWPAQHAEQFMEHESGAPVSVAVGDHCKYCRSYTYCPAKTALAIRMGKGEEIEEMRMELTPETAGRVYLRAKAAQDFLAKIFQAIYGMAENEPIEFSPGQFLGMRTKKGNEKLDGAKAREVLKLLYDDQEIVDAAVQYSATKVGIERALRGKVKPLGPAVKEVVDTLKKHGGITRAETTKVREYEG